MPKDCATLTITDVPDDIDDGRTVTRRHLLAGGVLVGSVTYYLREEGRL